MPRRAPKRIALLSGGLIVLFAVRALADAVPDDLLPAIPGHVLDLPKALDPKTDSAISDWLDSFETRSGNRVLVVMLDDLNGRAIEDWGAGLLHRESIRSKRSTVLVVAPKQQQAVIATADGLKSKLPADVAAGIIRGEMRYYTAARLSGEILRTVSDVLDVLTIGHVSSNSVVATENEGDDLLQRVTHASPLLVLYALLVLLAGFVRLWFRRSINKRLGGNASDAELDGPESVWWNDDLTRR